MRRSRWEIAGAILLIGAVLLAWQLAAQSRVISPVFFPEPLRVADSLSRQFSTGSIWEPLAATAARTFAGWLVAVLVGIALGAAIGLSRLASELLDPTLEFLRTLPASAALPIIVLVLGLNNQMIMTVITFGALWPVLLSAVHGFRTVDPRLREVAKNFELGPLPTFFKITLQNAVPDILSGARVAITFALILAIVAEMLSSQPGLGNNILLASRSFRSADMYAGIALLGVLGAASAAVLAVVEARLLRWRPSAES